MTNKASALANPLVSSIASSFENSGFGMLELPSPRMKELTDLAFQRVFSYLTALPSLPTADLEGLEPVLASLKEPMPREGKAPEALFARLFDSVIPKSLDTAGPGHLSYVPGGGLFASAVADFIVAAVNRYATVRSVSPALVELETAVLRWFCGMVGWGGERRAGGVLTSGGSMANFSAVVAARRKVLGDDFQLGTIYVSDQVHHSVDKAAMLAGFPVRNLRKIPVGPDFRMDLGELERQIESDLANGFRPCLIVGTAGTTNTGAVDPLEGLARIARERGLWFHVDAAYGGFFLLTQRGKELLRGIESAHSVTLDPHKGLFVPYGTGCLLVRDVSWLEEAHRIRGEYMEESVAGECDPGRVDFCDLSLELTRNHRGLRIWLPIQLHGIQAFENELDEKLDLAAFACRELDRIPGLEVVAEPQLSTVAFRVESDDRSTQMLLQRVNAKGRVHLSATRLGGRLAIRICVLSFRTHLDRIEQALEDIRWAAVELAEPVEST